jgi:hypothetical protein
MSDRRTWRALHPSTRGVPVPAQDLGQSRSCIAIEPASVPEAATKPALRHAGPYGIEGALVHLEHHDHQICAIRRFQLPGQ